MPRLPCSWACLLAAACCRNLQAGFGKFLTAGATFGRLRRRTPGALDPRPLFVPRRFSKGTISPLRFPNESTAVASKSCQASFARSADPRRVRTSRGVEFRLYALQALATDTSVSSRLFRCESTVLPVPVQLPPSGGASDATVHDVGQFGPERHTAVSPSTGHGEQPVTH